jgi:hypothetical protein
MAIMKFYKEYFWCSNVRVLTQRLSQNKQNSYSKDSVPPDPFVITEFLRVVNLCLK